MAHDTPGDDRQSTIRKLYPFDRVLDLLGSENRSAAAAELRISYARIKRFLTVGVTMDEAEIVRRVGLHPFGVWPEMVDDLVSMEDEMRSPVTQ